MSQSDIFPIFLVAAPGTEAFLADEASAAGFASPKVVPGGVEMTGGWPEIWRANRELRGAARILVRIAEFRAMHPAQLDKRARKLDWAAFLRPDVPFRVEATCRKSKIYHAGAAISRVEKAIVDAVGAPVLKEADLIVKVRIDDDLCTISLDTSGEGLHKRGHKPAVGKAPMRENLAAMMLRASGFDGSEPVVDPMCGSGTFVLEAAEIAAGLTPGRSRRFAFEDFAGFDAEAYAALETQSAAAPVVAQFYGFDRDAGAIKNASGNAKAAGVSEWTHFTQQAISDLEPPEGPPGLVIVNPPYGARIGNRKMLFSLYGAFGKVMQERFKGWRVSLVTSDGGLAKATGLPWVPNQDPIAHGGIKVTLWKTAVL